MRYWTLSIPLLCFACRGTESPSAKCDRQSLIELGDALANASESEQIAKVWPGLEAACADGLPAPVRSFYQPPVEAIPVHVALPRELAREFEPLLLAVCPSWTELGAPIVADAPADQRATAAYRACSLQRFGVLEEHELGGRSSLMVSWAMHQVLLDQGLEPAQAKPITRALMRLEGRVSTLAQPIAGQTWPVARGVPLSEGFVVYVTRDAIAFDGRAVLTLTDGVIAASDRADGLLPRVYEELGRSLDEAKQEFDGRGEQWMALIIAADAKTPVATIMDLLPTGDEAGFEEFGLVVDAGPDGIAQLPITALPHRPAPAPEGKSGLYTMRGPKAAIPSMTGKPDMTIEISAQQLSMATESSPTPELEAITDTAALTNAVQALKRDDPNARRVAISAEPTVSVETLVAVIAAVRGPECTGLHARGTGLTGEESECLLPEVLLLAEPAHGFGSEPRAAPTDSDEFSSTGYGASSTSVDVKQGKATVAGDLDADIIRRIVRAHLNEVRTCYRAGLDKDPKLAGSVTIDFVIAASGKVSSSVVASSDLADASVANCIAKAVKRWVFPKPKPAGEVKVSYPFELAPA
jgi:biopolymer transport protein ExbD